MPRTVRERGRKREIMACQWTHNYVVIIPALRDAFYEETCITSTKNIREIDMIVLVRAELAMWKSFVTLQTTYIRRESLRSSETIHDTISSLHPTS